MNKVEMTDEILKKHAKYLIQRGTKDKILDFIDDKEYEEKILKIKGKVFLDEHKALMNNLVQHIDEIIYNYDDILAKNIRDKNIFLAPPRALSDIIKKFENSYKNISKALKENDKLKESKNSHNNKSQELNESYKFIVKYRKNLISVLGYNDFTGSYNIKMYEQVIRLLDRFDSLNKIDSYMKDNKINKDIKLYEAGDYNNIISFYCNEIKSIIDESIYSDNIKDLVKMKSDIINLKYLNLNKSEFTKHMSSIIKECKKKYIDIISNDYIDIEKYYRYNLDNDEKWSAYHYVFELGLKTCPYCNRQYITPIYSDNGRVRGDIDHFFSKSKYPYLSMSIYNLIPCCRFCNSSLKLDKEFTYNDNLNPFEYGISDILEFDFIPKSYASFYGLDDIEVQFKSKKNSSKELVYKAEKNCEIFKLSELYGYHSDIVKKIILKRMVYSDKYLDNLCQNYSELIKSKEDAIQFLLYQNLDHDDLDNPLSILVKDLIEWIKFY